MAKWTAALHRHAAEVAEKGCLICEAPDPCIHHEKHGWEGRDHNFIVGLCNDHHLERHSIGLDAFNEKYDVDMRKKAGR